MQFRSVAGSGGDAAGGGLGDAAGGPGRGFRLRFTFLPRHRLHPGEVDRHHFDPFGELEHRRDGVVPGEVQVVAAAVAGVAVVADPAERRPRFVLFGLGEEGEAGDPGPVGVAFGARGGGDDVDREAVVVVGVLDVAFVAADVFAVG